jgi:hypothetical protein
MPRAPVLESAQLIDVGDLAANIGNSRNVDPMPHLRSYDVSRAKFHYELRLRMDVFGIVIATASLASICWKVLVISRIRRSQEQNKSLGGVASPAAIPSHTSAPAPVPTPETEQFNALAAADTPHGRPGPK